MLLQPPLYLFTSITFPVRPANQIQVKK